MSTPPRSATVNATTPAAGMLGTQDVPLPARPARRTRPGRALTTTAAALAAAVLTIAVLTHPGESSPKPRAVAHTAARRESLPPAHRAKTALPKSRPLSVVMRAGSPTVPVSPPFTLVLHATASCWVQVRTTDGQVLLEATLPRGRDQIVHATAPLFVRLGNTGGIAIAVNAQPLAVRNLPQVADLHFAT